MTTKILKPRGSRAALHLVCAGSLIEPEINFNSDNEMARIGRALHALTEVFEVGKQFKIDGETVTYKNLNEVDFNAIAKLYDIPDKADELKDLSYRALKIWIEIKKYLPEPQTEAHIESPLIDGTIDVYSVIGGALNDWKSGYSQDEHRDQLRSYSYLHFTKYGMPKCGHITAIESWVRFGDFRIHKFGLSDLIDFENKLKKQIKNAQSEKPEYCPSKLCVWCPRYECVAVNEYNRSTINQISVKDNTELTRDVFAACYDRVKLLKKAIDNFDELLKNNIEKNGPLKMDDCRKLDFIDIEREKIDTQKAYKPCRDFGLSDGEFAECVEMSKTKLVELVRGKAQRGQKQSVVNELLRSLDGAKAITRKPYKKLTVVKT